MHLANYRKTMFGLPCLWVLLTAGQPQAAESLSPPLADACMGQDWTAWQRLPSNGQIERKFDQSGGSSTGAGAQSAWKMLETRIDDITRKTLTIRF